MRTETITTLIDEQTGESVCMSRHSKPTCFDGQNVGYGWS